MPSPAAHKDGQIKSPRGQLCFPRHQGAHTFGIGGFTDAGGGGKGGLLASHVKTQML